MKNNILIEILNIIKNDSIIIKNTLDRHTKQLESMEKTLIAHTRSLIYLEDKIKIYSDMYENNRENNIKLSVRVNKLENHIGIEPLPELVIYNGN